MILIRCRRVASALLISALAVLSSAAPAGAHGGNGTFTIESSTPDATGVRFVVRLVWDNDGHPAADATVTAVAIGQDVVATPVPMTFTDDGRYTATVPPPDASTWTVRFTAINPTGTGEAPGSEVLAQAPPTTAAETTLVPIDPSSTTGGPETTYTTSSTPGPTAATDTSGNDSDGLLVPVLAVAAIAGIVAVVFAVRRSRSH